MCKYEKQAQEFASKYNVLLFIGEHEYKKYFANDKEERAVFNLRLKRNTKQYSFKFGQSIAKQDTPPHIYDVLACLTKYDIGTYYDFLNEFGYNDNTQSRKTYKAVLREYKAVQRLFSDCIEELAEII